MRKYFFSPWLRYQGKKAVIYEPLHYYSYHLVYKDNIEHNLMYRTSMRRPQFLGLEKSRIIFVDYIIFYGRMFPQLELTLMQKDNNN